MLKRLLPILAILCICFTSTAQTTPEAALENIQNNFATENIFIHFDKENYVAGENIWFKAYVFSGIYLSTYSSVINVELLNDSGRVIDKKILPLIRSAAAGGFSLPGDGRQANYTVRAFTRRMMNFGNLNFYEHQLSVLNPFSKKIAAAITDDNIFFLPEGGNLIAGIPNVIAFKSADKYGSPVESSGEISDSKGKNVATFRSVHDGMGKFNFLPLPDETYTAVCRLNGKEVRVALPPIKMSGVGFQVQQSGNKKYIVINNEKLANDAMAPAYILAVMDNIVVFKKELSAASKYISAEIPLSQLPSGILQLTLFTAQNQPIAERMVFVNNREFLLNGTFKTDVVSLKPRKKNRYSFDVGDTLIGTFSVSVTDVNREIVSDNKENIISRVFLTNEIKGTIFNPLYYFESADTARENHLDLVMMTNGWRRYTWDQLLNNKIPALTYKDPNYITMAGKVYTANSNKQLVGGDLNVIINTLDSASDYMNVPVDKDGNFEIAGMIFQDSATISFQTDKKRAVNLSLSSLPLTNMFAAAPRSLLGNVKPLNETGPEGAAKGLYSDVMDEFQKKATLLNDVRLSTVKGKNRYDVVEERYAKGIFSGSGNNTIDFINDPPRTNLSTNIFEYLKGRLTSVNITGSLGNYFINYRNTRSLIGGPIPMALFVDGAATSTQQASTIPISEIALVKVFGTGFVGAEGNGVGGALAIFTKKAEDRTIGISGTMNTMKIEGFSVVKEFFSPDYDKTNSPAETDNRTTLYWDPYLETTRTNHKFEIPFFNSDNATKLRVVLQGVTADGKFLYIDKIIE